jgi:hypothetical protein
LGLGTQEIPPSTVQARGAAKPVASSAKALMDDDSGRLMAVVTRLSQ